MNVPELSVVVCTHNPRRDALAATLAALRALTLPLPRWELVVIDNASRPAVAGTLGLSWHPSGRVVVEPLLGLTPARLCGITETRGGAIVFADDDNVLAPAFLAEAAAALAAQPEVGVAGGRVRPRFEEEPPGWTREFFGNLALCDHGAAPLISDSWQGRPHDYPPFAPVGAGLEHRHHEIVVAAGDERGAAPVERVSGRRGIEE